MVDQNARIYLSPPHMSGQEQEFIASAFATNWIAPLGPNVDGFEQDLARLAGTKGAVALSSGTAAIHLALKLLDVGVDDSVFCSSFTFAASANPIAYQGAKPVFIDSDHESWNMSPQALKSGLAAAKKKGKLPKAVIIVNLYGQCADMDALLEICNSYNVPIIEDAAESLGAYYKGRPSGSFGVYGIFSFNGNKIITTSGGGALVSNNLEALNKARFWATQARNPARHYQHSEIGYNYRMSNILAGVGRGQIKVLEERVLARRRIFDRYVGALAQYPGITFMPELPDTRGTRWLTTLTINPDVCAANVNSVIDALEAENIESRPTWKPLHLQPVFKDCDYYPHDETNSVSDELFVNGICLPSGSSLSEKEQDRVIEIVEKCLKG